MPAKPAGKGAEPTAGGGINAGKPFTARAADAVLDVSFNQIEIYLFPKPVACREIFFADPPYVKVIVDTGGAPLPVGRPAPANGKAYVQVDFHPQAGNKYYAIQPGAAITFTRVDPTATGVWHGRLTVKRQQFEGKTFAYDGTFAARWCGKD